MSIREEFEKAFLKERWPNKKWLESNNCEREAALWAAKWMAERCAIEAEKCGRFLGVGREHQERIYSREIAGIIRQLAEDLDDSQR